MGWWEGAGNSRRSWNRIPGVAKNQDGPTPFPTPGSLIDGAATKVGGGTFQVVNVSFLKGPRDVGAPIFHLLGSWDWCGMVCSLTQLCLTLWDFLDYSLSDSSVHGIFQAEILEWVAISSSRVSSRSRDWTCISCISWIAGGFFIEQAHQGTLSKVNCEALTVCLSLPEVLQHVHVLARLRHLFPLFLSSWTAGSMSSPRQALQGLHTELPRNACLGWIIKSLCNDNKMNNVIP